MRMPKKAIRAFADLTTLMPTFSEPLGLINVYFSAIDGSLNGAIEHLLGAPEKISYAQATAITDEINSFATRLRIFRRLLQVTKLPVPVKRANVARNRIVHAHWIGTPAKAKFAMMRTRRGEFDVYPHTVRAHANIIRDAHVKLAWALMLHLLGGSDGKLRSNNPSTQTPISPVLKKKRTRKPTKKRTKRLRPRLLPLP